MSAQPNVHQDILSRAASRWVRWGIPAFWLGWGVLYTVGVLTRDPRVTTGGPWHWIVPALVVVMALRWLRQPARWAQVYDAGDALLVEHQGRRQRIDLRDLRAVEPAWLIPPVRLALQVQAGDAPVIFLPARGRSAELLATDLMTRADARRVTTGAA
ncbi:hypothetical protein LYZ96_03300 [Xanthomonas hortorum pv. vitians]|uniref:PH domain-containing protein n=1 Tax=Xanthomonas hortorum pv. vitians TaxID=83224 RepID=A0AAW8ZR26_9XANT|nr:hypothetical protein [Xanthomonas hortorum]APP84198.1 hypothetical protein BI317_08390 [Xanthomonas hortorum pv. gardneri]MCE4288153.1 hypothetical protein [Xanthomonas hortorum pv. vitians]MCE4527599.1 hypothetical protein [Xanthomonas hortorum pv. vitians]MDT7818485.1 hypothetical protein [Xanthomonas hortorum pv. vitians]MDV7249818.1 hypothetical protein [Xanthomonas hortorum pv. vitians]